MKKLSVSLVVPTYNEGRNIGAVTEEIYAVMQGCPDIELEMIVVDDGSPDGTAATARALARHYPVRVLERPGKSGLGSAVAAGFEYSTRPLLAVMDGDGSHDPAVLPTLIRGLCRTDITIASRFADTSEVERWTFGRKYLSLAGVLLARKLTRVEDPLSGYFACHRRLLPPRFAQCLVSPGYKILLEILLQGQHRTTACYPYIFRQRKYSTSKLNYQEYLWFAKQLMVFATRHRPSPHRSDAGQALHRYRFVSSRVPGITRSFVTVEGVSIKTSE